MYGYRWSVLCVAVCCAVLGCGDDGGDGSSSSVQAGGGGGGSSSSSLDGLRRDDTGTLDACMYGTTLPDPPPECSRADGQCSPWGPADGDGVELIDSGNPTSACSAFEGCLRRGEANFSRWAMRLEMGSLAERSFGWTGDWCECLRALWEEEEPDACGSSRPLLDLSEQGVREACIEHVRETTRVMDEALGCTDIE